MKKLRNLLYWILPLLSFACSTSKEVYSPSKKYPVAALQEDYQLFRNILEESHPGIYWYTPKDSMDYFFDRGLEQIKDSMTETHFRNILTYVITKINCGHTVVAPSKQYNKYLDTTLQKLFPLGLKFWGDTMVVTADINRKDSNLKRGTIIKNINGLSAEQLRDTMFDYMARDGYSQTGKYQSLSNGFTFGSWYKNLFGLPAKLDIIYNDSVGNEKEITIPAFDPFADTSRKYYVTRNPFKKLTRKERKMHNLSNARSLQIDTVGKVALMSLNTFSHGNGLHRFFHKSFKTLDEDSIKSLIIDLRSNGGGDADNSTLLTKYIINKKFKIADSLYAVTRHSQYSKYIGKSVGYDLMMWFMTHKEKDGKFHFGYFERKYFKPKTKHHFNGDVYLIIGGNSFSATTLFAGAVKGQENVTLVGEETGGGRYGNNAWMIPEATLPNTKIRFRLPKFRLVVNKNWPKDGRGVLPDVLALPTVYAIKHGIDYKIEKATELIRKKEMAQKENAISK